MAPLVNDTIPFLSVENNTGVLLYNYDYASGSGNSSGSGSSGYYSMDYYGASSSPSAAPTFNADVNPLLGFTVALPYVDPTVYPGGSTQLASDFGGLMAFKAKVPAEQVTVQVTKVIITSPPPPAPPTRSPPKPPSPPASFNFPPRNSPPPSPPPKPPLTLPPKPPPSPSPKPPPNPTPKDRKSVV